MGIIVEFDPELALRNISEFNVGKRRVEECIPDNLEVDKIYDFLKSDQRNYWLFGEIPLIETKGGGVISRPVASIILLEITHFVEDGAIFTRGKYRVVEVFKDESVYFESTDRLGSRYIVSKS